MNTKVKGFLIGAVAAATYGVNPLFTLPLYAEGLTADSVLFYRYALAAATLWAIMKFRKQSLALRPEQILPLVAVGLLCAASSLFLFLSYHYMDAGIASTILFVYPVMVAVIMAMFFREKITRTTIFSILLALGGIGLLYRGGDGRTLSTAGFLLVMLSALSYAVYIIGIDRKVLRGISGMKLTFYALLSGLSIYIVRLWAEGGLQAPPSWPACGNIVLLALLPTVISLSCTALAARCIGATPTAILGALEPVTAVFFGVTVFGERLTLRLIIGILLIIGAVTLIVLRKTEAEPPPGLPDRN